MPFASGTTPFTGDNDIADFMTNVWLPFARDDVGWLDNQAPIRSPEVTSPEFELWTSRQVRQGSPGAGTSPEQPLPPYVYYRSDNTGNHMHVFTGIGFDDTQEAFDQPENPMNHPQSASYSTSTSWATMRCIAMNDLVGTFQSYWLFAPESGEYIHCVLKISSRHYRHFHVGMLTPLHPDLDDNAFYVTGQFWDQLDPSAKTGTSSGGTPPANGEHDVYGSNHCHPFHNRSRGNELDNSFSERSQFRGMWLYMPGLAENSPEINWYMCIGGTDQLTAQGFYGDVIRKQIGDVNSANDAVIFGCAEISGYAMGLGSNLMFCDQTFTSNAVPLIPIYVGANVLFQAANRLAPVAQIPDVFRVNMRHVDAEQEITIGSDTYVCFPAINKDSANVLSGEGYSGYEGYAYKKITGTLTT